VAVERGSPGVGKVPYDRLARAMEGRAVAQEPLSRHTTYGIGGPADLYVEPHGLEDLRTVMRFLGEYGVPVLWIGAGSNLLVSDQGLRGLVVRLNRCCSHMEAEGEHLRAGSAMPLGRLVRGAADRCLGGIAYLAGIPGTLGGAVKMNAGAFGHELGEQVEEVELMTRAGEPVRIRAGDLRFRYREVEGLGDGVILSARLLMTRSTPEAEIRERDHWLRVRQEKQPEEPRSCGSVFKRVPGEPTPGELIEKAGCKGLRHGGAQVSRKHANFIVNLGGASAEDVWRLVRDVRTRVEDRFGVRLPLEMETVGVFPEEDASG